MRLLVGLVLCLAATCVQAQIYDARYAEPTDRYPHGVFGDPLEWGALIIEDERFGEVLHRLPSDIVFEDTAPRVADLTGDSNAEVVVVESHIGLGARLAVWGRDGRIAATSYIGTRFRWLAPAAIGDLDGDGRIEIAYVDRPHLARTLRVVRYEPWSRRLTEIAAAKGHTNHRIGDRDILGGLRTCDGAPEIVTATPDWSRLLATRLQDGSLVTREIGANAGPEAVERALVCR